MDIYISDLSINLENMEVKTYILKMFFMQIGTLYAFIKITNVPKLEKRKLLYSCIAVAIASIVITLIKYNVNQYI